MNNWNPKSTLDSIGIGKREKKRPSRIAEAVRNWITAVGAKTAYIEPGSPWENGYCESFNARLRGEVFY